MGRSIGSGPTLYLSSWFSFWMVVVISGFISIKEVVKDKVLLLGNLVK